MTHPNFFVSDQPGHSQPSNCILPLAPHELVTNDRLRELAQIDPLQIARGDDAELQARLSIELAEISGELLACRLIARAAMEKGLA